VSERKWPRLHRISLWPRTLAGQLVAVTALAVLISNVIVVAWFTLGTAHNGDAAMTERLLDRAASTAVLMSTIPPETRDTALRAFTSNFFGTFDLHKGKLDTAPMTADETQLAARLKVMLPEEMAKRHVVVHLSASMAAAPPPPRFGPPHQGIPRDGPPPDMPPHDGWPPPGPQHGGGPLHDDFAGGMLPRPKANNRFFEVVIPISDDTQLVATFFRPPVPFWSMQLILAAIVTIIISSLAAAFSASRMARPLSKLAEAASLAAHGGEAPRVPEEGPEDVRKAASAFNAMNDQVRRTLESQRHLLSAVGHDLRTPITAMRINIEFVQDAELSERLEKNLDELQALTEAVLSAARGAGGEKMRQVDLAALVESLCADLDDIGLPVTWKGDDGAPFLCRPNEMRRAVRNLIENAVAYGKKAEVSMKTNPKAYEVHIEDEGPGIPEKDRVRVFEPFVRLEDSRNLETGGVGLGLTLAKSIAEGHGGSLLLEDREGGGLRVRMILPR
jgi:signal transduction histidine kinase